MNWNSDIDMPAFVSWYWVVERYLSNSTSQAASLIGGKAPLTWLVNGALVGSFDRFAAVTYVPPGEGVARVTVVDADGRSDTSEIRFQKLR